MNPSSVRRRTISPSSSMCAVTITRGASLVPSSRAISEPRPSVSMESAMGASSRRTRARTGPSKPLGP